MSWKMVELGKIGKISTGNTPPKNNPEFYKDGNIVFVKPNNFNKLTISLLEDSDEYLTERGSFKARIAPKNSVLVTCIGIIGNVGIASKNLCFNQQINAIIPDEEISTSRYLAYAIIFRKEPLQAIANAPIVPIINKTQFSLFKIPLPPLETQKRIVELLDRAQVLIVKRKEQIGLMDHLIQSLFYDMFGNPVANSMGWDLLRFEQVCSSRLGKMLDKQKESGEHQKQYLRNANVKWFSFDLNEIFSMDFLSGELKKFRLKYGDILICEGGEPGRAAIWKDKVSECYYQKALHRARIIDKKATGEYIVYLFWYFSKNGGFKDHISSATIAHLTGEKLKKMTIPVPPVDLQNAFAERVQKIETQKEAMTTSLHELEDNFNSLMQRAFKGEI